MRAFIDAVSPLLESYVFPPDDPRNIPVLQDMMTRAPRQEIIDWSLDSGSTPEELEDQEYFRSEFSHWLDSEHSVSVSNGLVSFWRLDDPLVSHIIGDNPVLLYHFTSSSRVRSIRRYGLVAGKRSVNRTKTPGVYLTSEASGPAIKGYLYNALRGTKTAYGVRVEVKTWLHDLQPDPDDADIQSGATQFVTDDIPPDQIVGIERAGW